jgi:hypothetical protein
LRLCEQNYTKKPLASIKKSPTVWRGFLESLGF